MTVDVAKKVSIDIIEENLTNLLTSILPFKRSLERHYQFMLICLEYHPSPIRQSTAWKRLEKDRKYFQDVIPELESAGLIIRQNKYYFVIPAHFVRKISEGVSNPFTKSLEGVKLEDKFLTMQESYGLHALLGTYFHDYPEHLWEKLRGLGSWEAEDYSMKRFVFDPLYTEFEGIQYTVKMFKHVFEVYGPKASEKDPNNRIYRFEYSSKVGRFVQWFVDKRLNKGKLKVNVREDKIRFHETNRTFLFQEIANRFYEQGYRKITTNDWGFDCSPGMPEWEAFQNYVMVDREGIGSDLVDETIYFPRFFVGYYIPYQQQLLTTIQTNIQKDLDKRFTEQESVNMELVKSLQLMNDNLQKSNRSLENLVLNQEHLATKEDIEILQEHLQKVSLKLERAKEKRVLVGLDTKCQKILNKLESGSLTRTEIALFLGVSDTSPLTQLKKLLAAGLIEEEDIETGKRGRPKKKYKLKGVE